MKIKAYGRPENDPGLLTYWFLLRLMQSDLVEEAELIDERDNERVFRLYKDENGKVKIE
ncbi:MAG: hypothetical protein QXU98_10165 [Candidatus Parvarchaeota archaeon]